MSVNEWREWAQRTRLSLAASLVVLSFGLMAMGVALSRIAGIYGQAQAFVWVSLSMLLVWLAIDAWVAKEHAFAFFFLMLAVERVYLAFELVLYPGGRVPDGSWLGVSQVLIFLLLCGVAMRITLGRMIYRARLLQVLKHRRAEQMREWREDYMHRVAEEAEVIRRTQTHVHESDGE